MVTNQNLTIPLIDQLLALFLVEDFCYIAVSGFGIFSDSINPIFLRHLALLFLSFGDSVLFEGHANTPARRTLQIIGPLRLDADAERLALLHFLLGGEYQPHRMYF